MILDSIGVQLLQMFISTDRSYYKVRLYFGSSWSNQKIDNIASHYDNKELYSYHAKSEIDNEQILKEYLSKNLTITHENTRNATFTS